MYDLREERKEVKVLVNKILIDYMERLVNVAKTQMSTAPASEKTRHGHRVRSFNKALAAIKNHSVELTSGADAKKLKGIGEGMAKRFDGVFAAIKESGLCPKTDGLIEKLIDMGMLPELVVTMTDEQRAVKQLTTVTGIGSARAKLLFNNFGINTVDELIQAYNDGEIDVAPNQLTAHMVVGLTYYDDLLERIPWKEVSKMDKLIGKVIRKYPDLNYTICGSYRRKRDTCGDIDVLVTSEELASDAAVKKSDVLPTLVKELTKMNFLIDNLTDLGRTKYMGVCRLKSNLPARRIDIRLVSRSSYAPAILYFTGSGEFNKIMRGYAQKQGYTINEYGIYRYVNGVKIGDKLDTPTEKDIFNVIDCMYLKPQEREF